MIIDYLENLKNYKSLHKSFEQVIEFIENNDIYSLKCGKHEIDSDNIYVNIQEYETKKAGTAKAEAHKKYIDIQMVLDGNEQIGYANIKNTKPYSFYDNDKDIEFLNADVEFIKATNKNFFILFPQDAHLPSMAINDTPSTVKKAVFKIKIK